MPDLDQNKGYKFRLEYRRTVFIAGDDKNPPGNDEFTFVTYGDSPKETVQGNKELYDEWDKTMKKEEKRPYRNKKDLK